MKKPIILLALICGFALGVHTVHAGPQCVLKTPQGCARPAPYQAPVNDLSKEMESWVAIKTGYVNMPCDAFNFQHGRCL